MKRSLTLIEVVLAIGLLALLSTTLFVSGSSLLKDYHCKEELRKIQSYFDVGKKLSLTFQSDVNLSLKKESGFYYLELASDEPAIQKPLRIFKKIKLSKISSIIKQEVEIQEVDVFFTGSGWTFPKIDLVLNLDKKKYNLSIDNTLEILKKK